MTARDKLILKLKILMEIDAAKQKQYQEDNNLSPDTGCITREACEMVSLLPQMQILGITLDDIRKKD